MDPVSPDSDALPPTEGRGSPSPIPAAVARLAAPSVPSRYESQKRRDWHTFLHYLRNQRPPLALAACGGAHVVEFLRFVDQFGKTKVHVVGCGFFGLPGPPARCSCPLRQAWGSLDALIGRLRAAFEEIGGRSEANPFAARAVRVYLRDVRESQAKARGITYEKKKRKRVAAEAEAPASSSSSLSSAAPMSTGAKERSTGDAPPGGSS